MCWNQAWVAKFHCKFIPLVGRQAAASPCIRNLPGANGFSGTTGNRSAFWMKIGSRSLHFTLSSASSHRGISPRCACARHVHRTPSSNNDHKADATQGAAPRGWREAARRPGAAPMPLGRLPRAQLARHPAPSRIATALSTQSTQAEGPRRYPNPAVARRHPPDCAPDPSLAEAARTVAKSSYSRQGSVEIAPGRAEFGPTRQEITASPKCGGGLRSATTIGQRGVTSQAAPRRRARRLGRFTYQPIAQQLCFLSPPRKHPTQTNVKHSTQTSAKQPTPTNIQQPD